VEKKETTGGRIFRSCIKLLIVKEAYLSVRMKGREDTFSGGDIGGQVDRYYKDKRK